MTVYYVDYENVHAGVDGVDKLSAQDIVRIFYSPKADTMRIAFVEQALAAQARIELISVDVGTPNALDFQLVAWLYSELPAADQEHIIVSNDHGYDAAIRMGVRLGLPQVKRVSSIAEALGVPPTQLDAPAGKRRSSSRRGGQRRKTAASPAEVASSAEATLEPASEPSATPSPTHEMPSELLVGTTALDSADSAAPLSQAATAFVAEGLSAADSESAHEPAGKAPSNVSAPEDEVPDEYHATNNEPTENNAVTASNAAAAENISAASEADGSLAVPASTGKSIPPAEPSSTGETASNENTLSSNEKQPESSTGSDAPKQSRSRRRRRSSKAEAARADAVSKVTALLAAREIELLEDQLNVVVKTAQSASSKQEFYRGIIQKLGQKQGLTVYGQVKQLFKEITTAVAPASSASGVPAASATAASAQADSPDHNAASQQSE